MTIKKMLLLASAVMALVAFAAPAAASAAQWKTNGTAIGGPGAKDAVTLDGFLTMTAPGIVLGECEVHAETELWNESGVGTGTVTEFEIVAPAVGCHGTFAGGLLTCPITKAGPIGLPWHVDTGNYESTEEEGTDVNITGSGFFYKSTAPGCPPEVGAAGSATGLFGVSCFVFDADGDLKLTNDVAVELDGFVCDTTGALQLG